MFEVEITFLVTKPSYKILKIKKKVFNKLKSH